MLDVVRLLVDSREWRVRLLVSMSVSMSISMSISVSDEAMKDSKTGVKERKISRYHNNTCR